jgi:hypothetical protein
LFFFKSSSLKAVNLSNPGFFFLGGLYYCYSLIPHEDLFKSLITFWFNFSKSYASSYLPIYSMLSNLLE